MACDCEKCMMIGTFKKQIELIRALEKRVQQLEEEVRGRLDK